jgi:hypothetical protein
MVPHSLNVAYSDTDSQVLWEDSERAFRRGWRLDDDGAAAGARARRRSDHAAARRCWQRAY